MKINSEGMKRVKREARRLAGVEVLEDGRPQGCQFGDILTKEFEPLSRKVREEKKGKEGKNHAG